ncbi:MAG TPA: hypothetical protein VJ184_01060, partial [Chryseolinea sp.]|nr:hypothetical protein [Chryseolinea sp.]
KEELKDAVKLETDVLRTLYFENKGNKFEEKKLPTEAQFAPVYAIAAMDIDKDGDSDVVMGGNESNVRVRIGKSDANRGLILLNDGKGNFSSLPQSRAGLNVVGDMRSIEYVGDEFVFGINDAKIKTFTLH